MKSSKQLVFIVMVVSALLLSIGSAHALGSTANESGYDELLSDSFPTSQRDLHGAQSIAGRRYSQDDRGKLRSRSDVIREVKREYDAEVLKISLNKERQIYRVRVLMPNGKVRVLKINARR